MEELETLESTECPECPGPPPEFRLPPPPRPPFLTEGTFCSETPITELEDCIAIPMIDASYHTNPSLQSTALIITCTVVLLLMAAIVSVVFWKHKRKVQNLLPCKSAAGTAAATTGRGRGLSDGPTTHPGTGAAAVLYEDLPDSSHSQLHNHHQYHVHPHHQQQPSLNQHQHQLQLQHHHHHQGPTPTIEMLDVKDGGRGVFVCSSPGPNPYTSQDLYNPVYEELSNGDHPETDEESELNARNRQHHHNHLRSSTSKPASEDEFAEDELSVGEPSEARMLTTAPTWGTCPAAGSNRVSNRERKGRSPKSLDRRRRNKSHDVGEFHEGMLLDALLQLYPSVAGVAGARTNNNQRQQSVPSVAHRLPYFVPPLPSAPTQSLRVDENPYESVPVLGPLHRYSSQGRGNKESKSRKANNEKYGKHSHYPSTIGSAGAGGAKSSSLTKDYYGLHGQDSSAPIYTQVGDDYSDTYSQPTDRLYNNDDKYSQPLYYAPREHEQQSSASSNRLYQAQPDSSFGSDSGYSHHTTGTRGGSISRTNHRKDKHRTSQNSHHSVDYIVS